MANQWALESSIDRWLVSRTAAALFLVSSLLMIPMAFVFRGSVETANMALWSRLPWAFVGVFGSTGLFFLWFGMWRYWISIDDSAVWIKRIWFFVLLVGFWYGAAIYCLSCYLPRVLRDQPVEG
jgi:hypothetical protein